MLFGDGDQLTGSPTRLRSSSSHKATSMVICPTRACFSGTFCLPLERARRRPTKITVAFSDRPYYGIFNLIGRWKNDVCRIRENFDR
jgi:hypothetical protein